MCYDASVRFAILGSGSKGNSLVVEGGGRRVLVDCGYGPRELKRRLAHLDVDLRGIDALLITHGHGDHTKGARQLAGTLGIPTYATTETQRFCSGFGGLRNVFPIRAGERFHLGGLAVLPVATPHDAPGSVCFVIDDADERLGVCTDLGMPTQEVADALAGCHALVLEFNHDPEMLRQGPYSPALKRRIGSPRGHLCNDDGARLLEMSRRADLSRVLLAHLSEVNNTPELAMAAARRVVDGDDVELAIAPQHHPTGWLLTRRARRHAAEPPAPLVEGASAPARAVKLDGARAEPARSDAGLLDACPADVARSEAAPPERLAASSSVEVAAGRHPALERQLALFAGAPPNSPRTNR